MNEVKFLFYDSLQRFFINLWTRVLYCDENV